MSEDRPLRIVVTGGGTAGHINPALATAQELRERGCEVSFAGTPQGIESRLIPQEGFSFEAFEARGFNRSKPWTLVSSSLRIARSTRKAARWLRTLRPAVVVGFGGYVSIPVGLAASRLGIPLVIHEQNATPGLANRFLAKRARLLALTYDSAASGLVNAHTQERKLVRVGNPVRASLLAADRAQARASYDIPADALVLLAFGGSLGAQHLNEALIAQAPRLLIDERLHVLHVTGSRDYEAMKAQLSGDLDARRWHLIDYCDRMGDVYAAADLVLSRAGATTLAELAALGKPAILVPYPHAAADEQTNNARDLVAAKAAYMIADVDLDSPVFVETVEKLLADPGERERMRAALLSSGGATARQDLASLIMDLAK
ncbi:MAG: undecaprenyldiphospho-muramoylpentapeptide beta-N-acetylglucosaminyltransferase [Coriobacteriales bacterium]|jgi:UDP-N-acetylglucosamine--N-acetylmuramyl-(pentapeptide) pyrophosphoryl-undecaprenol N-acetylglucosamine transferase|nr:undecaprenyldiphospho-muramoylpentapeptide beta-N-acetylglucosaminyltransferase [Coriobacteriales bacterium]